ncbi:unnamed protein product [Protopolystoma xenopodis]|uniref:Uncharacterized protein n=1 Tax=Protopolystoma xenopodis TaxID=117903 RepID=A0A3S5BSH1_9PLAT|nr:unnamed protein product [Protopolystoma xenopodis]
MHFNRIERFSLVFNRSKFISKFFFKLFAHLHHIQAVSVEFQRLPFFTFSSFHHPSNSARYFSVVYSAPDARLTSLRKQINELRLKHSDALDTGSSVRLSSAGRTVLEESPSKATSEPRGYKPSFHLSESWVFID